MELEQHIVEICEEEDYVYWKDALLAPKHRGSRTRIIPHPDMLKRYGYVKQITVLGELTDVLFDTAYIDYYTEQTGIDYRLLWNKPLVEVSRPLFEKSCPKEDLTEMVDKFLKSVNVEPSAKNPRHSLFVKFVSYLENQNAKN